MLAIKQLTKTYNHKKILDNVSLSVNRGSIAILLGSSGVGKSTLLRILNNLETYDSGSVLLDGKSLDLHTVNQHHTVGMVFQQFNLFDHFTVEENISFPLEKVLQTPPQQAQAIAQQLLQEYGLADKAHSAIGSLSGGQKQRLAIARAIAMKPIVICMDEPTSALDPMLTASIAKTINHLAQQGYIILVASHDIGLVQQLHGTIYLMDQGTIIEEAPTADFSKNPTQYKKINNFVSGSYIQMLDKPNSPC